VRASLAIFCCISLAAVAYAGANYHSASSQAPPVVANQERGFHYVSIPELIIQHPSISEFRAVNDRPLFAPSRRPTPAAATAQVSVYRLRGVLTTESQKIALVESIGDGTLLRLYEGDTVDIWRVYAIGKDSITWSRLDQFHEMVVAEMWEEGEVLSSPDAFQPDLSRENGPREEGGARFSPDAFQPDLSGESGLTHAADYAAIDRLVMPTAPLPPTPKAPRPPQMRRVWNLKGRPDGNPIKN
jgi:hypothetical protein